MPKDEVDAAALLRKIHSGAAQAARRRDQLADAADALADGMDAVANRPWPLDPERAGSTDQRTQGVDLNQQAATVGDIVRHEAVVNVRSAGDQMRGFAHLLRAKTSTMGAVVIARGIFEACVWTAGVLDSSISSELRLKRSLNRRLARLSASLRLNNMLNTSIAREREVDHESSLEPVARSAISDDSQHHIDEILQIAKRRGWKVKKGRWSPFLDDQLSIDWLAENLDLRFGLESYAWGVGPELHNLGRF